MSKINSNKNSKLFNIMTNPITIIITLVVISSIILLYTIYLKSKNDSQISLPPYIPNLDKSCENSLVWSPLCFILYVTNLDINWVIDTFNLETFRLIQDKIVQNKYTPKDLMGSYNANIAEFNADVIKSANDLEKTKTVPIDTLTNWGSGDDVKMFYIIKNLKIEQIVRNDFLKNISQNFIDCMYNILLNYGGPVEVEKYEDVTAPQILSCVKKILPPS